MTPHTHRRRVLRLCGMLHGLTHVYHVALLPLFLLIQHDLHLGSLPEVTLLQTVMMIAYFAPSYFAGMLADRMDRRTLLGCGLALNAAGFIGMSLAPNYAWAVCSMLIAGLRALVLASTAGLVFLHHMGQLRRNAEASQT